MSPFSVNNASIVMHVNLLEKEVSFYSEFCQKIQCFKFFKTISKDKANTVLKLRQFHRTYHQSRDLPKIENFLNEFTLLTFELSFTW